MNQQYKMNFLRAGAIAKEVRSYGKSLIQKGASYNDVIAKIITKIHELGAIPAFPPQIALNHVAAHFLPNPGQDIIFSSEVIKLYIGVCYKGAIGDCAVTIDLSGKNQSLIDAVEAALLSAEKSIKVGVSLGEIGKIIEDTIASYGYTSIKNLSGHGLGEYKIHTPPSFPNYNNRSKVLIRPNMTFAIEPFATNGIGYIYDDLTPTIFSLVKIKPVKSELSCKLINTIKTFNGLPFAIHDLMLPGIPSEKMQSAINELLQKEIITGYPPLIEEGHGLVAQAENSVLVDEHGNVIITTR